MKNAKIFSRLMALLLVLVMVFGALAACNEPETPPTPDPTPDTTPTPTPDTTPDTTPKPEIKVSVASDKSVLNPGETAQMTVTITGTEDKTFTWTVAPEGILSVNGDGVVSIVENVKINTKVVFTATANADNKATANKTFIVNPPVVEGEVGHLTDEAIAALGNNNITVSGVVKDIYQDLTASANNMTNSYDTIVKMDEGKWVGTWAITGSPSTAVTDFYRRGATDGVKDENGDYGHQLEKLYIGKNNTLVAQPVMASKEISVIWESQHLWNCLEELNVNKFTYDIDTDRYIFRLDWNNSDSEELMREAYLMTYLSYCLTPMMTETLETIMFELDENHNIVKMYAETSKIYTAAGEQIDDASKAETLTYTTCEFTFSDIGTTVVTEPVGYDAPENADLLTAALAKLAAADNYTYRIVDRTTQAPSGDSGDYEIMAAGATGTGATLMSDTAATFPIDYVNKTTGTGTVGSVGFVTRDAIVIGSTIQYSYSMDGKNFRTEYMGYKANDNGTYDMFEYDSTSGGFVGKRQYAGTLASLLPAFDVSANIFELTGMKTVQGVKVYEFTLREDSATREVAMALCAYKYATNAAASIADGSVTLRVDENGNLIDASFAYNSNDIYYGICTVKYENIGTTALVDGAFSNYVPRVLPTSWSAYTDTSYYHQHTTLCTKYGCYDEDTETYDHAGHTATLDIIFQAIFGEAAKDVPTPDAFIKAIGDSISTAVGFNWKDGDVEGEYKDFVSFNMKCLDFDENDNYYLDTINALKAVFGELGFTVDEANTDLVGGDKRNSSRWITFVKGDVQIVIENIHTAYFYVDIYVTGDWLLND